MRKLSIEWFDDLNDREAKDRLEATLRNNTFLVQVILKKLDKMEEEVIRKKITDDFSGDWSHKQAYLNGDHARIRKLRDLFSFIKD